MAKKLIIAEKPSLAQNIVSSIDTDTLTFHKEGYYEGEKYIVVPMFGHLMCLVDMDAYFPPREDGKKNPWTMDTLPFCPPNNNFKFTLKKDKPDPKTGKSGTGIKDRYNLIRKLAERNDVEAIINAGDSDREGETLCRLLLNAINNKKMVYRLWMPEQTEPVIRAGLAKLQPDSDYDNMFDEGLCRTYIDWLYGINFTRFITIKTGTLMRNGRVIGAITKAIYDREKEIENFVPVPFWVVSSNEETNGEKVKLTSKLRFDGDKKADAEAVCKRYNAAGAIVTDIQTKSTIIDAGKLYSLSTLQGEMGKRAKLKPKETLDIVQYLYEKEKCVTYPRTETQYLGETEIPKVDAVIATLQKQGFPVKQKAGKKTIYDSSKVDVHSALRPTTVIPKGLTGNNKLVYEAIRDRFVAVFCSTPCEVDRTTITINIDDEDFTIRGDVYKNKGWKAYDNSKSDNDVLPKLARGQKVNINFCPLENKTNPPLHYTVETLGKYLKNPFRDEGKTADENEDADYKAMFEGLEIGTEATRAGIIENAIANNYIQLKNNVYTILPLGCTMIETSEKLGIDMSKQATARLGKTLKGVYRGELNIDTGVEIAKKEITKAFQNRDVSIAKIRTDSSGHSSAPIAKCPICGGDVVETPRAFGCSNRGCKFVLWKDNRLLAAIGKKMTKSIALECTNNMYAELNNCVSKSGKKFNCFLVLDAEDEKLQMKLSFADPGKKIGSPVGKCLLCGSDVYETDHGFACSGKNCDMYISKNAKYFTQTISIDRKKITELLDDRHVAFKLKSKAGKQYDGYLKLKANGKYVNFVPDGFVTTKKK